MLVSVNKESLVSGNTCSVWLWNNRYSHEHIFPIQNNFLTGSKMRSANGNTRKNSKGRMKEKAAFFFSSVPFLCGHQALAESQDWSAHLLYPLCTVSVSRVQKKLPSLAPSGSAVSSFRAHITHCCFPCTLSTHTDPLLNSSWVWHLFPARNITDAYHNQCPICSTVFAMYCETSIFLQVLKLTTDVLLFLKLQ